MRPGRTQDRVVLSVRVQDTFSHIEITSETVKGLRGEPVTLWVLGSDTERYHSIRELIDYHHRVPIVIIGKDNLCLHAPE